MQKADFRRKQGFADQMSVLTGYKSHSAKFHWGFLMLFSKKEHMLLQ